MKEDDVDPETKAIFDAAADARGKLNKGKVCYSNSD